jgi:uncharacterized protein
VAELLRRPGSRRTLHEELPVHDVHVVDSAVPDGAVATVDVDVESMADGIVVTGHVRAPWVGTCRRCLEDASGELDVHVRELFQDPSRALPDADSFPIEGDQIDLMALVRDALLLELPLAPLCREGCAGLCEVCGANLNEAGPDHGHEQRDPRWAGLEGLSFPDEPGPGDLG